MKKRLKKRKNFEIKKRFQIYKEKKCWVITPFMFVGLIGGAIGLESLSVQAIETSQNTEQKIEDVKQNESIPVVELVKNSPDGFFYGKQISPSNYIISGGDITTPEDSNGASDKALDIAVNYGKVADGGVEFWFPVYSNTNYTIKYRGRDVYELGAKASARQGYKGSVANGEWWRKDADGSYKYHEIKFTTTNKNKTYQDEPKEGDVSFYIYSLLEQDGRGAMKYRLLNAEVIPNTPIIQIDPKNFNLELSKVYGKTHNQIINLLNSEIKNFIKEGSKDTNNNNNPVNTILGTVEDPDKIVTGSTEFKIPITACKWGVNKTSFITIEVTPEINEHSLQPVDSSGNSLNPTTPGKLILGKPGDHISVPKEDLPVVDGYEPNLPEDPNKPGNVLLDIPKDQQAGDTINVSYIPVTPV